MSEMQDKLVEVLQDAFDLHSDATVDGEYVIDIPWLAEQIETALGNPMKKAADIIDAVHQTCVNAGGPAELIPTTLVEADRGGFLDGLKTSANMLRNHA